MVGARYPDGVAAVQRIAKGLIRVMPVTSRKWIRHLAGYSMGDGEKDSIALCSQMEEVEALVTDDYLAFVAATRLGQKTWMLPDIVLEMAERGSIPVEVTEGILNVIRPRYRVGVIEHRAWQKITCHFHIPSSGHLHPILNLKVLEIVHYSCGFELSDRTNLA